MFPRRLNFYFEINELKFVNIYRNKNPYDVCNQAEITTEFNQLKRKGKWQPDKYYRCIHLFKNAETDIQC